MRRLSRCQLSVLLLLAGMAAAAQIPNSSQNAQPADVSPGGSTTSAAAGEAPATSTAIKPGVTITGKKPHAERPRPKLPPDEFTDCVRDQIGYQAEAPDLMSLAMCEAQLESEKHTVQHDYEDATKDEAEAIRLDPKLARAYVLRGAAFADLGDRAAAVSDIQTAVGLDPALARYVTINGRAVSLGLPP